MKPQIFVVLLCLLLTGTADAADCSYNSESSMLSRVVAVDSANGAVYGRLDTTSPDSTPLSLALNDKELVLTFDHGPNAVNTEYILYTLDRFCVKAVFFFTGSAALANPMVVRDTLRRGHTVAAGPWSDATDFVNISMQDAEAEIEKSLAAVAKAADAQIAPFFRIATIAPAPATLAYLRARGVSLWSYDIASGDDEPGVGAGVLLNRTLARIREKGKGVIRFQDTRKVTVDTLDDILIVAKQSGFKIVQPVPAENFVPKEKYLAGVLKPTAKPPSP